MSFYVTRAFTESAQICIFLCMSSVSSKRSMFISQRSFLMTSTHIFCSASYSFICFHGRVYENQRSPVVKMG